MEVHHPHHPTHKKKWSEYIIEFVMLFTAVTLGFIAENIREHQAEEKKSKELLEVVARDFETDIKNLEITKEAFFLKDKQCDTLLEYIKLPASKIPEKKYYNQLFYYNVFWMFNPTEKSRIDAESKGLFFKKENAELATYVAKYNFFLKDYKALDDLMITQAKICLYEIIPHISDPNVYPDPKTREAVSPNSIGVHNVDPASILRLKYLVGNTKDEVKYFQLDIDSLTYYANKAIAVIEKSK